MVDMMQAEAICQSLDPMIVWDEDSAVSERCRHCMQEFVLYTHLASLGEIARRGAPVGVLRFLLVVGCWRDVWVVSIWNEQLRFFEILEYTGRYGFPEILIEVRAPFLARTS